MPRTVTTPQGTRYTCKDWGDLALLPRLTTNPADEAYWLRHLPDFDCFLDCGPGFVGSEAWQVKAARPSTKVFGFEPAPARFHEIKDAWPGDELLPLFVGDRIGDVDFHITACTSMAAANLPPERVESEPRVTGQATTLDTFASDKELGTIVIWADIEGSEARMLAGAVNLIESGAVVAIVLELWSFRYGADWSDKDDLISLLSSFDYHPRFSLSDRFPLADDLVDIVFMK